jgi:hypothetical protein
MKRDIYHSADTIGIRSTDITRAFFTGDDHKRIALVFNTGGSRMVIPADTEIFGMHIAMKDYIFVGRDTGIVTALTANGDTVFLSLSHPTAARTVSYISDKWYTNTSDVYEGPWLTNAKGLGAFSFWKVPIYEKGMKTESQNTSPITASLNPSSGSVQLKVALQKNSFLRLELFDESGRKLSELASGMYPAGEQSFTFNTRKTTPSNLVARATIDDSFYEKHVAGLH